MSPPIKLVPAATPTTPEERIGHLEKWRDATDDKLETVVKQNQEQLKILGRPPNAFATENSPHEERHGTGIAGALHLILHERTRERHVAEQKAKAEADIAAQRAKLYDRLKIIATIFAIVGGLATIFGMLRSALNLFH